ncbi:carboxypeptidase-like regulatory domain-containing protein [Sphingobacterium sp. KU25419]|nr:carboxypeptidase-like regulatory domain-containing protein [Sphingobacterium sp. KU25419]
MMIKTFKNGGAIWFLLLLLTLCVPITGWAQQATITGKVLNNSNQPLAGVLVSVQGSTVKTETATNEDGSYSIQVTDGASLLFKFIGYESKEEVIGARKIINVILMTDETELETVVVVGYGTQKKMTLTGAVAGVKGSEMRQTKMKTHKICLLVVLLACVFGKKVLNQVHLKPILISVVWERLW